MASMSVKCSVYIATSMDGFIARKNGDLDWLPGSDGEMPDTDEDYGYADFFASIDTLVMGRKTYELVCAFGEWPYTGKKVIVLSSAYPRALTELREGARGTSLPPAELVAQLADSGIRHIYVDGGRTIQSFLAAGLIQEMTITRIPILIGEGIPLFGPLSHDIELQHLDTRSYESGFVQSKYAVMDKNIL
jgi:dihydrofolate reductase